jgi:hypothetical protein
MTQALYAHMNNKRKKKRKIDCSSLELDWEMSGGKEASK